MQRPEKSDGLRTMTLSWENVQTEGTKCKGLGTGEVMCDMFEKQPKANVERLRVVRDEVKEVMVVGRSNETGH